MSGGSPLEKRKMKFALARLLWVSLDRIEKVIFDIGYPEKCRLDKLKGEEKEEAKEQLDRGSIEEG
jgi:hypothetical protein